MRPAAGRYTRAGSAPIRSSRTACICGPRERWRARCAIPSRIAVTSSGANGGDGCAMNAASWSSANGPGTPRCYRPARSPGRQAGGPYLLELELLAGIEVVGAAADPAGDVTDLGRGGDGRRVVLPLKGLR
jgi:hypothetical protein